ncbi:hypothetical protein TNCV_4046801 [Trichonephila clavipes]|nr:hypothetical protein TNCV_4046801 [Trichonephila clavipes]
MSCGLNHERWGLQNISLPSSPMAKLWRELLRIVGIGGSELWRQPRPVTGCYAYKEEGSQKSLKMGKERRDFYNL